jgi:hypothetical protein
METTNLTAVKNIVLVHGAFADGSGWKNVYTILKNRGFNVSVVGNPNTGLEDDVAATNRVLDRQDGRPSLSATLMAERSLRLRAYRQRLRALSIFLLLHRMKVKL